MELSIICVNWNSAEVLGDCIDSIYEQTSGTLFEIIVVDNASTVPGIDALRSRYPGITILKSDKNLGFAGANNLGFANSTGEFLLFLNPDTKLLGPAINVMLARYKSLTNPGILGCKLLNSDLSVQLSSIQKFPTITNQVLDLEYLQLRWPRCRLWELEPLFSDAPQVVGVDAISGACMLVRREVFLNVGRFSEDYFMYGEDIDLNYKVKSAGYQNFYVGETSIIHYGGRSSSQQKVSHWNTIMKCRAMRRYFRKTRGRTAEWLYRSAMSGAALCRLAVLAIAYPLGNLVTDRASLQLASKKWRAVLTSLAHGEVVPDGI